MLSGQFNCPCFNYRYSPVLKWAGQRAPGKSGIHQGVSPAAKPDPAETHTCRSETTSSDVSCTLLPCVMCLSWDTSVEKPFSAWNQHHQHLSSQKVQNCFSAMESVKPSMWCGFFFLFFLNRSFLKLKTTCKPYFFKCVILSMLRKFLVFFLNYIWKQR